MTRSFYQSHECAGFRAKVTIEWAAPEGIDFDELDRSRVDAAEEIAGEMIAVIGPKTYEIVQTMRGRSSKR